MTRDMRDPTHENVGFIGLGSQGAPMAHRILRAGMGLTVWARRADVCDAFHAKGSRVAASVAELGAACDHVGVCVLNDADVTAICDQLLPAMKRGSRVAIHSTVLPETCATLAAQAASHGIALIDAPVSGGAPAAEKGALTVMCGGDRDTFEACHAVFETFGAMIVLLGPVGAGQRAKIINNAMMAAHMGLAHGAFAAAAALGLDREAFAALINASSGRSYGFEVYARLPEPAAFAVGAPLLLKDTRLLDAILPGHAGARIVIDAAEPFLLAATGDRAKD
jgi:3-hydroxyisobutyrate dehydrogenase-like beta-hydroxyacid dehydrogenase